MSRSEKVRFSSQGLVLSGTLHWPTGMGPHPALLMLQGSGAEDRDSGGYFPPIRNHFIENGLAVFSWDKPGIGGSEGDWRQRTLFDRSDEALDALAWLREQQGVDPERVGVWGHSQGGWVGPLVASRSRDVAFLVVNSGPGVTLEAQDLYGMEHILRRDGVPQAEIEQALGWMRALHDAARAGTPFEQVNADLFKPNRGTAAETYFGQISPEDWPFFVLNFERPYDPVAALEQITCPMLALFGEFDPLVPVEESARIFEEAARAADNHDLTIHIFPGADHRIRVGDALHFASGYLETMSDWLRRRTQID
ncbi:MAG: alpha/beta fold hydrolase [Nitrolancea sp.]